MIIAVSDDCNFVLLMAHTTHKYTNGKVTVVWKPGTCQHSGNCWRGLLSVFDPRKKPWINMDGATTERIIEQVKKCPSGALGYFLNSDELSRLNDENNGD